MQLPHGYTNTTEIADGAVRKTYVGPDADRRHARERALLAKLRGVLPVPEILAEGVLSVTLTAAPGRHAQELIDEGAADRVLFACGQLARDVHAVPIDPLTDLAELGEFHEGDVLVHGDFGPQNLLIDVVTWAPTALLDWEFASFGDPVDDLAWAEWIVRMHHPDEQRHLLALFGGYGSRPTWRERKASMMRKCTWALEFVRQGGSDERLWEERIEATSGFGPLTDDRS